jgi:hypothetical protein
MDIFRRRGLVFGLMLCVFAVAGSHANATNYYWDKNGSTAGAGATPTGTWGSDAFWNPSSTGGTGTCIAAPGSGDSLYFVAGPDVTNSQDRQEGP